MRYNKPIYRKNLKQLKVQHRREFLNKRQEFLKKSESETEKEGVKCRKIKSMKEKNTGTV